MNCHLCRVAIAMVLGAVAEPASAAVSVGLTDTFQDGTTQGWASGANHPSPPANSGSGGPAGAGDMFLLMTALGGAGSGSRLVTFSGPQWAGDYISAGVTGIGMDLNNLGGTDLSLRLAFDSASGSAFSTVQILVPAGSGWTHAVFAAHPGALTGPASAALSGATQFRLFHSVDAIVPPAAGQEIVAQLGIDNVTAVPEPGTWSMLGAGLATLAAAVSLRRRRSR